jgi:CrcB protein
MAWLMVAAGGAIGSVARYGVAATIARWFGNPVPMATAIVNIAGCAVAGLLMGLAASGRLTLTVEQRALIFTGILGGLTTFSGLGMDTLLLVQEGRTAAALTNILAQLAAGVGILAVCFNMARG